jgi:hypothetical protein
MFRNILAAGALAMAVAGSANAGVVFDTRALQEPDCDTVRTCETETRSSGGNYGTVLSFSADVTIAGLGVWTSVDDAQDVKFLIFDSLFNGGTGAVLFSQTKSFAAAPAAFIYADPFSFTFQAGRTYDIGILGNGINLTGRWCIGDLTVGAITAISSNANINNFGAPTTGGYAGVVPYIQLVDGSTGAVPEPQSWALMIAGFGLVGAVARRRAAAHA